MTKIVVAENPAKFVVAYTETNSEHPDNERFIRDVEQWCGVEVVRLRSPEYRDVDDVIETTRYIVGPMGARCTTELKKKVRWSFERPDDIQCFGYVFEEQKRAARFQEQNPGVTLRSPLIEYGLTKPDCLAIVERAGIKLPEMYKLGYPSNNCIGCVKGGMGYWNKIRVDFPEVFARRARQEREIGVSICSTEHREMVGGKWKRVKDPVFLDELRPDQGNLLTEPSIECGPLCELAEETIDWLEDCDE